MVWGHRSALACMEGLVGASRRPLRADVEGIHIATDMRLVRRGTKPADASYLVREGSFGMGTQAASLRLDRAV